MPLFVLHPDDPGGEETALRRGRVALAAKYALQVPAFRPFERAGATLKDPGHGELDQFRHDLDHDVEQAVAAHRRYQSEPRTVTSEASRPSPRCFFQSGDDLHHPYVREQS